MSKPTRPPLRYHGGKWRAADKIIPLMPPHMTYVEPFGGGGSILLRKNRSKNEIYNDLDGDIVNVFKVLRDPCYSKELLELLAFTPFSRSEMFLGWEETSCPVEQARRCIVRSHMGFGSAGATKGRTGFRGLDRCEGSFSAPAQQWSRLPHHLKAIINRLQGVVIENVEASRLINTVDSENTLFYVDPPYLPTTRSSMKGGMKYYRHEMSEEDHVELLEQIQNIKGMVLLSGYDSELYNDTLTHWEKVSFKSRASSGAGTVMRNEYVWIKPGTQNGLFA